MNRIQASLYLTDQLHIEALRLRYNPVQARLIPAHVTLCREDEVTDWDAFGERLESLCPFEITVEFGAAVREDNFVFLPVRKGLEEFQAFRCKILGKDVRKHTPHVTLIHPRNGACTDEIFADISSAIAPFCYTFREAVVIEQNEGGVWKVISRIGQSNSVG